MGRLLLITLLSLALPGTLHAGCPTDVDRSGVTDVSDLVAVILAWGTDDDAADVDGNAVVDVSDLVAVVLAWGPCPDGACCHADGGGCSVATERECAAAGGVFGGAETDCADLDSDGIPNVFETGDCTAAARLCFSSSHPLIADTDMDGIKDGDEFFGTAGGLALPAMGCDPCRRDLLVEVDWVHAPGQPVDRNKLHVNQVARVIAAFDQSGVSNPNGVPGIKLHLDIGQPPYGGGNGLVDPSGNDTVNTDNAMNSGEYYTIKNAHFAANRHGYFRYCVLCDKYSINGSYQNSSGRAELPGDDLLVSMGQWTIGDDDFVGNTVMHELGHNLVLRHGGFENRNFKPCYNSVMNYNYQFCGNDGDSDAFPDGLLDYSHGTNIALNESSLNETIGVTGTGPSIDWNQDGDAGDVSVALNINCRMSDTYANSGCVFILFGHENCGVSGLCDDSSCNVLADSNDWAALQLQHLGDIDFAPPEVVDCLR